MESNYRIGILPRGGGWNDQDPDDISMIRIASQKRAERIKINEAKAARPKPKR